VLRQPLHPLQLVLLLLLLLLLLLIRLPLNRRRAGLRWRRPQQPVLGGVAPRVDQHVGLVWEQRWQMG
jgi:di/tricarboxylate transporter